MLLSGDPPGARPNADVLKPVILGMINASSGTADVSRGTFLNIGGGSASDIVTLRSPFLKLTASGAPTTLLLLSKVPSLFMELLTTFS